MHDPCRIPAMATPRIRTTQAKRAFAGAFAACVAATAMAYSSGGLQHSDEAPDPSKLQQQQGGQGGGDTASDTQDNSQGQGSYQVAGNGAAPGGAPGGGLSGASGGGGPGDNNDGSDGPGFMPNGEDGLMTLASFA